jgi:prepilin-type N-terminal cleavage/methylation domain-containing protein
MLRVAKSVFGGKQQQRGFTLSGLSAVRKRTHLEQSQKGFTLIELLIVIAIIAVLATVVIINVSDAKARARDTKRITDTENIAVALTMFKNDKGHYPYTADGLVVQSGSQCSHSNVADQWSSLAALLQSSLSTFPPVVTDGYYIRYCNGSWDGFLSTPEGTQNHSIYHFQLLGHLETESGNGNTITNWDDWWQYDDPVAGKKFFVVQH